jgi:hypothetical protein
LIRKHETAQNAENIKATTLKVQAKPIDLNSRDSIIGKTMPPADDPELTMPNTVPRRLLNHDVGEVNEAVKMAPEPIELRTA